MAKTPDMDRDEMIEVLKAIIRDGRNGAARIAAIKELRAIQGEQRPPASGFEALDGGGGSAAPKRSSGARLKAV